jgi:hypothetical protein
MCIVSTVAKAWIVSGPSAGTAKGRGSVFSREIRRTFLLSRSLCLFHSSTAALGFSPVPACFPARPVETADADSGAASFCSRFSSVLHCSAAIEGNHNVNPSIIIIKQAQVTGKYTAKLD